LPLARLRLSACLEVCAGETAGEFEDALVWHAWILDLAQDGLGGVIPARRRSPGWGRRIRRMATPFTPRPGGRKLLRFCEVADVFAISTRTVRRLTDEGVLPVVRIGRSVRVASDDVERFIEGRPEKRSP
jgi:excisionase family DNA binding protein